MSYEIWTAHRYGSQFGLPETKLKDELTEDEVRSELPGLSRRTGMLLHNLLVVREGVSWRANRWLTQDWGTRDATS